MKTLSLDFETYSEAKLKETGMHKYIWHPSFEIICLAWSIDYEDPILWLPTSPIPERLVRAFNNPECLIYAFNAGFEREVIKRCYRQMGLTAPPSVKRYRDTMALSCSYSYPGGLDKATEAMQVPHLKDKRGKYLINKLCKPKKWSRSTPFTRWTPDLAPQDFEDFYNYCLQDVRAEQDVLRYLPRQELIPFEQQVWQHTMVQNDRGIHIDYPLVEKILEALSIWKTELVKELSEFTKGEITTGGQVARMKAYCARHGVTVKSFGADILVKMLEDPAISDNVKQIMRFRQLLSKTSTAKFEKMVTAGCWDLTVKGNLYYWGAITGRYGGRGLQIQNLPRRKEKDPLFLIQAFMNGYQDVVEHFGNNLMEQASKLVRACLIAPPGKKLIVSDYSSIENRVLHWCAGDTRTLKEFEADLDQYKTFAADKFHVEYDDVTDHQRFHGKVAILGLGFQMGGGTYHATCQGYGLDIDKAGANETVQFYRNKYKLVTKLWFKLYAAAQYTVETGRQTQYLKAKFAVIDDHLFMKLPSGRCLCYPKPRMIDATMPWGEVKPVISFMGVNPYSKKWQRLQITPGRLTENLVQAAARDILVIGAMNVEKAGYPVIGSVHDEVMAHCDENKTDMTDFDAHMCRMPAWADGLPLKAVGYISDRYKKD